MASLEHFAFEDIASLYRPRLSAWMLAAAVLLENRVRAVV